MTENNSEISRGGFHHIAIKVFDFEKTLKFYIEGLGFKKHITWGKGDERAAMLDTGNGNFLEVFAGEKDQNKPAGAFIHLALRTDNCDLSFEKAIAAGAEATHNPADVDIPSDPITKVRIAFCNGPDGEVIEFFQNR